MKRSSSIAALDDSIDIKLRNYRHSYDESLLVSSMMLVTIEEERRGKNQLLTKQRSIGSMSATSSFSRSSSRGSLRGWGSSASRKSYKVDLCSLVSMDDFHGETAGNHHAMPKVRRKQSTTLSLQKNEPNFTGAPLTNPTLDSWGFFLD